MSKVFLVNETDETKSIEGYSCSFSTLGKTSATSIDKGLHILMDNSIVTSPISEIYQTLTNNFYTIYRFKTDNFVYRLLVPNNG